MIDSRLQLLVAVSEYGTVTAAAEVLFRSPSGVSRQIKQLEAEIDLDLLEHEGRRVKLTPAGQRLVEHTRALNAQWESALSDTASAATELCGPVSIGGFATILTSVVTPAVVRLREDHQMLRPMAKEIYSQEITRALETGAIDVGLFVADESTSRLPSYLEVAEFMDDPIDLLVHQSHAFAARDEVRLEEARQEEWVTGLPHQDSYKELYAATRSAGYAPRSSHYAQDLTATAALVAAGLGISAVPRIAQEISHPQVRRVPLAGEHRPHRRIMLTFRGGSRGNPRIRAVIDALERARPNELR
ncbi:LysR family transcriptional regulator [Nesterenkonia sp. E16_7]|uniref:LysR family transcriptional regulator n=1 Tax=unclassified Nesterenkonia TaxID=2629769 RepID=UPI001A91509C|nr:MULTISPECIES: LysR family transcriptional regulator [unclassified Nesterenkonia]MBO0594980.1 LysR family transcriptional regulator [Nesterenkonia sp. E16_10]MBO0598635.1 LysR family transcriptional regulator [Nesterenkonia sp. E16_7]